MRRRPIARRSIPRRRPILASSIRARRAAIADQAGDLAVQLEETLAEMNALFDNAKGLIRHVRSLPGGRMIAERAEGYWIPALNSYLNPEAPYDSRAMVTPMNTVNELMTLAEENGGSFSSEEDEEDWDD